MPTLTILISSVCRHAARQQIINQYGSPFYVKIDIEHFDQFVLEEMFEANIRPKFISAECHDISVFAALVSLGKYNAFKIVDGGSVATRYKSHPIETREGSETYSFPAYSAGPFGDDIPWPWLPASQFFYVLSSAGLGWKDVHATNNP